MGKITGKVCAKHPELSGLRYDFNHTCVQCHKDRSGAALKKRYYSDGEFAESVKHKARIRHLNIKLAVLCHYGMQCARCGIGDHDVLNIDHINQKGSLHRAQILGNGGSNKMYRWLINNNLPPGFRTLCFNCNVKTFLERSRGSSKDVP